MKYAIVYNSLTGNTALLANAIKEVIDPNDLIYFGKPDIKSSDADLIYVGFWTKMGQVDPDTLNYVNSLNNKKIFLFGSAGYVDESYAKKIIETSKALFNSSVEVVGSFVCQGKMGMKVRERYVAMKNANPPVPNADFLIANFDEGLKHPNKDDFDKLKSLIK